VKVHSGMAELFMSALGWCNFL